MTATPRPSPRLWTTLTLLGALSGCDSNPNGPRVPSSPPPDLAPETKTTTPPAKSARPQRIMENQPASGG